MMATAGVVHSDVFAYHATALTYNFKPNSKSIKYAGGIVARIREMFWYFSCTNYGGYSTFLYLQQGLESAMLLLRESFLHSRQRESLPTPYQHYELLVNGG